MDRFTGIVRLIVYLVVRSLAYHVFELKKLYLLVFKYGCEKQINTTKLTGKSLNILATFTVLLKKYIKIY
jgi:hypothetical protein